MPGGTTPLLGGAAPLSGGATPPSGVTPLPGEISHQHLGRRREAVRSLEGIPPLRGIALLEGTQQLERAGPPGGVRTQKETPRLKLTLLMKSMLVLLPTLMQADKPQLKGSYLPLGRSALPAMGVIIQRSRGSPGAPVPPAEKWPPPPHTANGEMPEEPPPPPLARAATQWNHVQLF